MSSLLWEIFLFLTGGPGREKGWPPAEPGSSRGPGQPTNQRSTGSWTLPNRREQLLEIIKLSLRYRFLEIILMKKKSCLSNVKCMKPIMVENLGPIVLFHRQQPPEEAQWKDDVMKKTNDNFTAVDDSHTCTGLHDQYWSGRLDPARRTF